MDLKEVRIRKGRIELTPIDKSDLPLFLHCSGGLHSVTTRFYNNHVGELLFLHGVGSIGIKGLIE